jgi:hypothetical protein
MNDLLRLQAATGASHSLFSVGARRKVNRRYYVGFTSNGISADRMAHYEKLFPGVLDDPDNVKAVNVYVGDGVNAMSFAGSKYLAEDMKRRGHETISSMTRGIHGWPWFRRYFAEFAQVAFR